MIPPCVWHDCVVLPSTISSLRRLFVFKATATAEIYTMRLDMGDMQAADGSSEGASGVMATLGGSGAVSRR